MIDQQPEQNTAEDTGESDCRQQAVRYLARREYSQLELGRKLRRKGHAAVHCDRVIAELVSQNLLSDRRYAEAYLQSRVRKGLGPMRIRVALEEVGVDKEIIDDVMNNVEIEWTEQLKRQVLKKYGDTEPETYKEWVKRARFLNKRGFSSEQIQTVLEFTH